MLLLVGIKQSRAEKLGTYHGANGFERRRTKECMGKQRQRNETKRNETKQVDQCDEWPFIAGENSHGFESRYR
jgi:hypothetical protein